ARLDSRRRRDDPGGEGEGHSGHGRGHAAPLHADGGGGRRIPDRREDEPAAPHGRGCGGGPGRDRGWHAGRDRDGPCTASLRREGAGLRRGALRDRRPRDGARPRGHGARREGRHHPSAARGADEHRAGEGVPAPGRHAPTRFARGRDRLRPVGGMDRRARGLPLPEPEHAVRRVAPPRARALHHCRRPGRLERHGVSAVIRARTPTTPREWLGADEPFPWPALDALLEGTRYSACYCVANKQLARTREEKPYLRLLLCDRSGEIEGRIWDYDEQAHAWIEPGDYVGIRGRIQTFRGQRQLKVEEIAPLSIAPDEFELFLPRSPHDLERLEAELDTLILSIEDAPLQSLVSSLLGAESETGRLFRRAPAAKRNHHAYVGGLLEHSVSVATAAESLARHYGGGIDRDLLIAGALVHDIGKVREIGFAGGFPYTDEGKLLGHIVIGI